MEADEVNEAAKVLKPQKSLLKTSESSRLLNSAYFDLILMFWKKKVFW